MDRHSRFFNLARELSKKSVHQFRLGAVIVKRNRVIGRGTNSKGTHTFSPLPHKTLHAEIAAVLDALKNVRGCDIYVYRTLKNGNAAMAKPCECCHELLKALGIRKIYYSVSELGG